MTPALLCVSAILLYVTALFVGLGWPLRGERPQWRYWAAAVFSLALCLASGWLSWKLMLPGGTR